MVHIEQHPQARAVLILALVVTFLFAGILIAFFYSSPHNKSSQPQVQVLILQLKEDTVQQLEALNPEWPAPKDMVSRYYVNEGSLESPENRALRFLVKGDFKELSEIFAQDARFATNLAAKKNSLGQARPLLQKALQSLRSGGDVLFISHEFVQALTLYQQASQIAASIDAITEWQDIQFDIAIIHQELGLKEADAENHFNTAIDIYRRLSSPILEINDSDRWARIQLNWGNSLLSLSRLRGNKALLIAAEHKLTNALTVFLKVRNPTEWATVRNTLGVIALRQGESISDQNGLELLQRAESYLGEALEIRTHRKMPLFWAASSENRSIVRQKLAGRTLGLERSNYLFHALTDIQNALDVYNPDSNRDHYGQAKTIESNVLRHLAVDAAEKQQDSEAEKLVDQAEIAAETGVTLRLPLTQGWASSLSEFALIHLTHGQVTTNLQLAAGCFAKAISSYNQLTNFYTKEKHPDAWANLKLNTSATYINLAKTSPTNEQATYVKQAELAANDALEIWTTKSISWAKAKENRAISLWKQARFAECVESFRECLDVFDNGSSRRDWKRAMKEFCGALQSQTESLVGKSQIQSAKEEETNIDRLLTFLEKNKDETLQTTLRERLGIVRHLLEKR